MLPLSTSFNIQINITYSRQLSTAYLFGITSPRLTRECIENRLCFWYSGYIQNLKHFEDRTYLSINMNIKEGINIINFYIKVYHTGGVFEFRLFQSIQIQNTQLTRIQLKYCSSSIDHFICKLKSISYIKLSRLNP